MNSNDAFKTRYLDLFTGRTPESLRLELESLGTTGGTSKIIARRAALRELLEVGQEQVTGFTSTGFPTYGIRSKGPSPRVPGTDERGIMIETRTLVEDIANTSAAKKPKSATDIAWATAALESDVAYLRNTGGLSASRRREILSRREQELGLANRANDFLEFAEGRWFDLITQHTQENSNPQTKVGILREMQREVTNFLRQEQAVDTGLVVNRLVNRLGLNEFEKWEILDGVNNDLEQIKFENLMNENAVDEWDMSAQAPVVETITVENTTVSISEMWEQKFNPGADARTQAIFEANRKLRDLEPDSPVTVPAKSLSSVEWYARGMECARRTLETGGVESLRRVIASLERDNYPDEIFMQQLKASKDLLELVTKENSVENIATGRNVDARNIFQLATVARRNDNSKRIAFNRQYWQAEDDNLIESTQGQSGNFARLANFLRGKLDEAKERRDTTLAEVPDLEVSSYIKEYREGLKRNYSEYSEDGGYENMGKDNIGAEISGEPYAFVHPETEFEKDSRNPVFMDLFARGYSHREAGRILETIKLNERLRESASLRWKLPNENDHESVLFTRLDGLDAYLKNPGENDTEADLFRAREVRGSIIEILASRNLEGQYRAENLMAAE
jgi:hypothetical protein